MGKYRGWQVEKAVERLAHAGRTPFANQMHIWEDKARGSHTTWALINVEYLYF
jgi:hypothetical protein